MKTRFISFLLLLAMGVSAFAQSSSYQPTEENLKARQEFQDNKFGIFLHFLFFLLVQCLLQLLVGIGHCHGCHEACGNDEHD